MRQSTVALQFLSRAGGTIICSDAVHQKTYCKSKEKILLQGCDP